MSLKPSPKNKLAIYLGLGLGLSGELVGSAWVGWLAGAWWTRQGGSKQAPGLFAAAFVIVALCHVVWLLLRLSSREES